LCGCFFPSGSFMFIQQSQDCSGRFTAGMLRQKLPREVKGRTSWTFVRLSMVLDPILETKR
jgi:hypothetical protein